MTLFNYYYYFGLFLIIHARYLLAYQCHECGPMVFNYSITADNLPPPNRNNCAIVTTEHSCNVRVLWYNNGASEVYYSAYIFLPDDSVYATTERKVTAWSGEYVTDRFLAYTCKASNTTPCNTVENLKRAIISTTFPTDEQIQKFDSLIVPTTEFFGGTCSQVSNMTDCGETNIASCQQCRGMVQYSTQINVCTTCPSGVALMNFFDYRSTFLLNNQTRSDMLLLGCRKFGPCNSIENMELIKNTLISKFDFDKFYSSTASITSLSMIVLLITFITELFRLL